MRAMWVIVIVAACLVVAVAAIAYAAGRTSAPEVIRAQRFELVDARGNVLGVLGAQRGDRGLLLFDGYGELRARLTTDRSGRPGLQLFDCDGRLRAGVGQANLVMAPARGGGGHGVSYPESSLLLYGEHGRAALKAVIPRHEGASVELRDEEGKAVWSAP